MSEERIFNILDGIEIVDAHEHLPPEKVSLSAESDVFSLVEHYVFYDLFSAGMDWKLHEWSETHGAELLGLVMFAAIIGYMIWDSLKAKVEE